MEPINFRKLISLFPILLVSFIFQNCGEEGFVSSDNVSSFGSFEEVYPSMDEFGDIKAKYEAQDKSYLRDREYLKNNDRIYRAVGRVPASILPTLTKESSNLGGSSSTSFTGTDVPVLEEPGFAGVVNNYYSGIFTHMKSVAANIERNQRFLYPDRYYGEPKYQEIFESEGMGIIRTDLKIGVQSSLLVNASFYQYKADYFRKKAVVFIIGDRLFNGSVGAGELVLNQQHFVKLARKGYLVVHLKPKSLRNFENTSAGNERCENLEEAFYFGAQEVRTAIADTVRRADFFGLDPDQMYIVGFGEGGTLAAYTAFLDKNEAAQKFGRSLLSVPGFEGKSLFRGVGISGGGVMDSSILNGASKARVVTIHGGCDESVKVDGSEMYGCLKNGAEINPISSKKLTDFAAGYMGSSASVLNCSAGADTKDVRSLDIQLGYFATYFHNIMGPTNGSIFSNIAGGISTHYQNLHCSRGGRDGGQSCNFPAPLINNVSFGSCTAGPCTPPQPSNGGNNNFGR